jgi:hypothetical protein
MVDAAPDVSVGGAIFDSGAGGSTVDAGVGDASTDSEASAGDGTNQAGGAGDAGGSANAVEVTCGTDTCTGTPCHLCGVGDQPNYTCDPFGCADGRNRLGAITCDGAEDCPGGICRSELTVTVQGVVVLWGTVCDYSNVIDYGDVVCHSDADCAHAGQYCRPLSVYIGGLSYQPVTTCSYNDL